MTDHEPESLAPRESRIDRAIDRAVRKMVQIDPPAGLRRRVLSRLGAPAARRPAFTGHFALATAALAILLVVIGVERRDSTPEPPPHARPTATVQAVPPAPIPPESAPVAAARESTPVTAPSRRATGRTPRGPHSDTIAMPRIANVFGARGNTVSGASVDEPVATLSGAAPWLPAPADRRPIEVAPLSIVPLSMEPVTIAPIPTSGKQD